MIESIIPPVEELIGEIIKGGGPGAQDAASHIHIVLLELTHQLGQKELGHVPVLNNVPLVDKVG